MVSRLQKDKKMKNFTDRMWLVILGVAVAILVTLTTMVWSEPSGERTGSGRVGVKPVPQAVAPKIAVEALHIIVKSTLPLAIGR